MDINILYLIGTTDDTQSVVVPSLAGNCSRIINVKSYTINHFNLVRFIINHISINHPTEVR